MPGGAAGHYLLGLICRKTHRSAPAIAHFRSALTADPFCWSAYEELCALGDERQAAALLDNAKCGDVWLPSRVCVALTQRHRHARTLPRGCARSADALYPPGPAAPVDGGFSFVTPDGAQLGLSGAVLATPAPLAPSLASPRTARCVRRVLPRELARTAKK